MQQQKTSTKGTWITMIIIIIIALALYFYYKGEPKDPLSSLEVTSPESEDVQIKGDRVLTLLNQIKALKIDARLFDSAVYKSLKDYTVTVPEQPVGRANPFAPIR